VFFEGKYKYKILYLDDAPDENILIWFKEAFDFINEAINNKGKVYVHCAMGISRSASVVIGYLMYVNKLTYDDAFEFVYNKRKQICPNKGFVKQLQEFEEMLIKVNYTDNVFNIINQDIQEE
jgi:protein-tyrosine phosphatase